MATPVYTYTQMSVRGELRPTQYRELPTSPTYAFNKDNATSTRDFCIRWKNAQGLDNIPNARKNFLGFTTVETVGGSKYLHRVIPYDHPRFPDDMFALEIPTCEPFVVPNVSSNKDTEGLGYYEEAKLKVNFGELPYNVLSDDELNAAQASYDEGLWQRYVNISMDTTGKNDRIPSGKCLKWVDDQTYMTNAAMIAIVEGDVTVVWYQIPIEAVPWTAIRSCCQNKTNSVAIGVVTARNKWTFQAESLICFSPKMRPQYRMSNGAFATDITYRFKWVPNLSANHFYKWKTGTFVKATKTGANDNTGFYKTIDFRDLFRPEP